jgi:hypothetical protein
MEASGLLNVSKETRFVNRPSGGGDEFARLRGLFADGPAEPERSEKELRREEPEL